MKDEIENLITLFLQIEISTTIFQMIDKSSDQREFDLNVCQNDWLFMKFIAIATTTKNMNE